MNWQKPHIDEENRFGIAVTAGIHIVLLIIAILWHIRMDIDTRPAYIEVALGEYQTGSLAEFAEQQPEEVATQPDPAEVEPEEPEPEVPEPEEVTPEVREEAARPVDLADQIEEVAIEPVTNPVTEQINPESNPVEQQEEVVASPPRTEQAEEIQEGEEQSGDEQGLVGDLDVEQGIGNDADRASPYDLRWEGDLERSPMVQPLPENRQDVEATITVRFEVTPQGSVGRIIPLRKMNPRSEEHTSELMSRGQLVCLLLL